MTSRIRCRPKHDPLTRVALTPSQRALGKYLFLVVALFCAQVFLGGFTAHYTVEGQEFYGIDVSKWFPYALVRTWHLQAALFWIATGFLAAGLFLAPVINGGKDPKYQKLGVDVLFWALVVVCVGSFIGNYLTIAHVMPQEWNFWLGHQGYEYVDLGRLWQIGKFAGIAFWLVLMARAIFPALLAPNGQDKNLLALLTSSVVCIGLFYGAGLFYGERTHISVMEYWRWWVVHLWVEGFFEGLPPRRWPSSSRPWAWCPTAWPRPPAWRRPRCSCWAACPAPSTTCTLPAPPPR